MSNKYIIPYKQIFLDSGLLVIYEKDLEENAEKQPVQVVKLGDSCCLKLGYDHLVLLDRDSFGCIAMTRKILLAISKSENISGDLVGMFEIDDMAMGKLVAYLEGTSNLSNQPPRESYAS